MKRAVTNERWADKRARWLAEAHVNIAVAKERAAARELRRAEDAQLVQHFVEFRVRKLRGGKHRASPTAAADVGRFHG